MNDCWAADFMSDALWCDRRFRTFKVVDDFNREVLVIKVDFGLKGEGSFLGEYDAVPKFPPSKSLNLSVDVRARQTVTQFRLLLSPLLLHEHPGLERLDKA
jgi:hypothetical protein